MATPDFVQVAPDGAGKKVDTTAETDSAGAVERQRVSVAGIGSNNTLAIDAAGKIGVNNFPATQPVSGTFWQATQPVSGTVAVSNLPATQPVSLAAASEADGHSATIGATGDASSASTLVGLLKAIKAFFGGGLPGALAASGGLKVDLSGTGANATAVKVDGSAVTQPVSGTVGVNNFPATQPISAAALPLPTGAATDANLSAILGAAADSPAAFTVLDRLKRIDANTKGLATDKTLTQVLAALSSRPKPAPSGTLLHR